MGTEKKSIPKTERNDLTYKIRELRSNLGMTQEQFAAKIGVTFSTVNRWESGKSKPSPLAMRQIEELMDLHRTNTELSYWKETCRHEKKSTNRGGKGVKCSVDDL